MEQTDDSEQQKLTLWQRYGHLLPGSRDEVRKQRGQTQAQLADLLRMTQANVSRIERSDNLYLSTLADYVDALGGHIEINAVFDDDVVAWTGREGPKRASGLIAPRCMAAV